MNHFGVCLVDISLSRNFGYRVKNIIRILAIGANGTNAMVTQNCANGDALALMVTHPMSPMVYPIANGVNEDRHWPPLTHIRGLLIVFGGLIMA
jgi:hypothetical protein